MSVWKPVVMMRPCAAVHTVNSCETPVCALFDESPYRYSNTDFQIALFNGADRTNFLVNVINPLSPPAF